MNRRGFLRGILAAGVAPYVSTAAGMLMPVKKLVAPVTVTTVTGMKLMNAYFGTIEGFRFIQSERPIPQPQGDTITYRRWLPYRKMEESGLFVPIQEYERVLMDGP